MIFSSLFVLALAATTPAPKPVAAPLSAEPCVFGVVRPDTSIRCQVTVSNPTAKVWVLKQMAAADQGVHVAGLPLSIQPGSTGNLVLEWEVGSKLGRQGIGARVSVVQADEEEPRNLMLRGTGFVYSVLDHSIATLDLGAVEAGSADTKTVPFGSEDVPDFRIKRVLSVPTFATAQVSDDHRSVQVGLSPQAQWGLQDGTLVLATNVAEEPRVEVELKANVLGAIRPSDNPYALGSLRTNNDNVITVPLTSMNGKPFKVGKISLDHIAGDVAVGKCVNDRSGCRLVSLKLGKDQPTGNLGSQMHIELPDYQKTLTVGFWGILLKPDTKIVDLNEAQEQSERGAKSQVADAPVDFGKVLKKSTAAPALPPSDPPGEGPVLRWSVANEQTLYGYLIYRAEHKDGPWQRVNEHIIPVLGHDDASSEYAWRDTSVVKGKTYWYFIKTLANNGTKKKLTDAHKVVAH